MLNSKKHNNTNLNFLGQKRKSINEERSQTANEKLFLVSNGVKPNNLNCNFKLKENRALRNKMRLTSIQKLQDNISNCPKAPHNTTQYIVKSRKPFKICQQRVSRESGTDLPLTDTSSVDDELGVLDEISLTGGTMIGIFETGLLAVDETSEETNVTVVSSMEKDHFFYMRDASNLDAGTMELMKFDLKEMPFMEKDVS
jgi:hypothetical protein